jgi:hypothetical protein
MISLPYEPQCMSHICAAAKGHKFLTFNICGTSLNIKGTSHIKLKKYRFLYKNYNLQHDSLQCHGQ